MIFRTAQVYEKITFEKLAVDFKLYSASRGLSMIAELLVECTGCFVVRRLGLASNMLPVKFVDKSGNFFLSRERSII